MLLAYYFNKSACLKLKFKIESTLVTSNKTLNIILRCLN